MIPMAILLLQQSGSVANEILFMNGEIKELIINDKSEIEIKKNAEAGGMTFLLQDGMKKASKGLTTADEILRVT